MYVIHTFGTRGVAAEPHWSRTDRQRLRRRQRQVMARMGKIALDAAGSSSDFVRD